MAAVAEILRFQVGCTPGFCYDYSYAAVMGTDSSAFLVGTTWGEWSGSTWAGKFDFAVVKVDSGGTLEWSWQDGSNGSDFLLDAAAVSDGGVVAAGYTNGTWNGQPGSETDFAAVKLDSDGDVAWTWQEGTPYDDKLMSCSATADGNVVVSGYSPGIWDDTTKYYNNIAAAKIDGNTGTTLWKFQAGTTDDGNSAYSFGASARPDGSVVIGGVTYGEFGGTLSGLAGSTDFIAVAVDVNGTELWRWQDGPGSGYSVIVCVATFDDNSVVLAGYTDANWDGEVTGGDDFAVVKLNSLGIEEWRWQGGTANDDQLRNAGTTADGSVILSGFTTGSWAATYAGGDGELGGDFAALALDADGTLLWTYQAGTEYEDGFTAVAVREDGAVLLAGNTFGAWDDVAEITYSDFAAVLVDADVLLENGVVIGTAAPETVATTPTPVVSATPAPRVSPTIGGVVEAPVSPDTETTSSSSGAPLKVIIGGVAGGAVLILLVGVVLARKHRKPRAAKTFGPSLRQPAGFPTSRTTATGGNTAEAAGYPQSAIPGAGAGSAYRQSGIASASVGPAYRHPAIPAAGAGPAYRQSAIPAAGAARTYGQSATPATRAGPAYQQPVSSTTGAGYAEALPPSYSEVVPTAGDPVGVTPPPPPYVEPPAYTR